MDCGVCAATGDVWLEMGYGGGDDGGGGFSEDGGELDLAMMVSDFLENGSGGAESWCSSDSDSGFSDLYHLAEKISFLKVNADQREEDLLSIVNSLVLSINKTDLHLQMIGCNASCIRYALMKLLRLSGFDAGVCSSKWQGSGKVPGGDHEYVDVVNYNNDDSSEERLIIDIDFRSHFEIARAVESYDAILSSLPVIYVGSWTNLNQLLKVMVEATRFSLEQNSMPLPPWRSLAYLQAKWQSPYQRKVDPDDETTSASIASEHKQCIGHLERLHSSLQAELEIEGLLKPSKLEKRMSKRDRGRRRPSFRTL